MTDVYAMVIPTEVVGRVRFTFLADGTLSTVSMRSKEALGVSGKRPSAAPTQAVIKAWLRRYLEGAAGAFPSVWHNPGRTDFSRRVYQVVAEIPPGQSLSYGDVAALAQSSGASRAVGTAMGKNPIPLVVP